MILIISRDDTLVPLLSAACIQEGEALRIAPNLEIAVELQRREGSPAALILDLDASGPAGFAYCRNVGQGGRMPVLLTGTDLSPVDRYEGFAAGASDVLGKPVDAREFAFRLRARLGRRTPARQAALVLGEAQVDLELREVRLGERRRTLTPHETAILRHLAARPGRCVPTEELLVEALGYAPDLGNPEVVRTHIRHLREKLEADPARPRFLVNIPRVGYRISLAG